MLSRSAVADTRQRQIQLIGSPDFPMRHEKSENSALFFRQRKRGQDKMQVAEVRRLREELSSRLATLADPGPRRHFLQTELQSEKRGIRGALLAMTFVGENLADSFQSGMHLLKAAQGTMQRAAAANRLLGHLWRDFLIVKGNHLARYGRVSQAIGAYRAAIDRESCASRSALGRLNIARVHMASARYDLAFRELKHVNIDRLQSQSVRTGILLARTRLLVSLGWDVEASAALAKLRGLALGERDAIELRYLGLQARYRFGSAATFERRLGDFEAFVGERAQARTASFYLAECLLVRRLLKADFSRRQAYLNRLSHLCDRGKAPSLEALARAVEGLFEKREDFEENWEAFVVQFVAAERQAHHLLCQSVGVYLIDCLNYRRRFEAARDLLRMLDAQIGRMCAGLPKTARMALDDKRGLRQQLALRHAKLPQGADVVPEETWLPELT